MFETTIDVETLEAVLELLQTEIEKYTSDSPGSSRRS